jgi:chemotaxis protein methyltransferase CheR
MDIKTFEQFCNIVYEKSGISINDSKIALVTARVGKRMREIGINNDRAYLDLVLNDKEGGEIVNLLDVISTNVTSFFREEAHFTFFAEAVLKWHSLGQRRFRFWSAASSTGEEPYSIAMTLLDKLGKSQVDLKILATDISTRVLAQGKEGAYSKQKLAAVPLTMVNRFFSAQHEANGSVYTVNKEVKKIVVFERLNLSEPPFPMQGPFDAVFCRNVMIYFDNIVRKNLLSECFRLLKPDGYLFVGHAESLTGILSGFRPVMPSVYMKKA